jgi:hypothetical protein
MSYLNSIPFSLSFILYSISSSFFFILSLSFYPSFFLDMFLSFSYQTFSILTLYFSLLILFPPSLFYFYPSPTFPKTPFLLFQLCRRWNPFNNSDCNQTGEWPTKHSAKPWSKFIHKLQIWPSFILCTLQTCLNLSTNSKVGHHLYYALS